MANSFSNYPCAARRYFYMCFLFANHFENRRRSQLLGDFYRTKAAELHAKALHESNSKVQAELEGLAIAYVGLAEQTFSAKRGFAGLSLVP